MLFDNHTLFVFWKSHLNKTAQKVNETFGSKVLLTHTKQKTRAEGKHLSE